MAASNEWAEWHLTPRGWERGDEKMDGSNAVPRSVPSDRVLTMQYSEVMTTHDTQPERKLRQLWRSTSEAAVETLLTRFGPYPERL